jgi:ABC-type dipeptide/oligopeptide/nickel transport system permease component
MRGMDYILKRTGFALITVLVAVTLNFVLFRAVPGSAISAKRCLHCTKEFKAALQKDLGLDHSKWTQYKLYLEDLAHGDLGKSYSNEEPVWDNLKTPIMNTLPMLVVGTAISIVLGVVTGVLAAWRRGTAVDRVNVWTSLGFYAAPTQWLGLLVIFYVATQVGLPVAGIRSNTIDIDPVTGALASPDTWTVIVDRTRHLILPALTLGLGLYGEYALIVRSSMLETLGEDYVLTARAKGLSNWAIVWRHGLRNAMLPLVTLIALSFGYILAGAIVVEEVFSYPGIGLATIDAIDQRDYPVLQGAFLLLTLSVIFFNYVADLLYFKLDPRVQA